MATATEGMKAAAFYMDCRQPLPGEGRYSLADVHRKKFCSLNNCDAELQEFFQDGQRYKVTITRAEEDGDGR